MSFNRKAILALALWGLSQRAMAEWTWNIGWQNPANATVGVNFLYLGSKWGFECGIGAVKADSEDTTDDEERKTNANLAVAGDIDVKYFFGSSGGRGLRPYLQVGVGAGAGATVGEDADAGAGVGGPFAGLGFLGDAGSWYVYAAYNISRHSNGYPQAGIGFDF